MPEAHSPPVQVGQYPIRKGLESSAPRVHFVGMLPPDRLELSVEDTTTLLKLLDDALKIMNQRGQKLSSAEISAKSMLTVIRNDLHEKQRERRREAGHLTEPPWQTP